MLSQTAICYYYAAANWYLEASKVAWTTSTKLWTIHITNSRLDPFYMQSTAKGAQMMLMSVISSMGATKSRYCVVGQNTLQFDPQPSGAWCIGNFTQNITVSLFNSLWWLSYELLSFTLDHFVSNTWAPSVTASIPCFPHVMDCASRCFHLLASITTLETSALLCFLS